MKQLKYNIILLSSLILGLTMPSCSDFLYQEPDKQISITEQFSSKEGLIQTVNGLYVLTEDLVSFRYFVYADLQGGNTTFLPRASDGERDISTAFCNSYRFDDLAEESDYANIYTVAYSVINAANQIMEHLNEVPNVDDTLLNQVLAEALAARAFAHYALTRHYAQNMNYSTEGDHLGVVYNHKTLKAGYDFPTRETKAQTYTFIKADLEDALKLFTDTQVLSKGAWYSYFNSKTVKALLATIALDHNDWETAAYYADEVIKTSGVSLMAKDEYEQQWRLPVQAVSEVILEFTAPTTTEGDVSSSVANQFYLYTLNGSTLTVKNQGLVASEDLVELYEDKDVRKNLYDKFDISTNINGVLTPVPYYFVGKFQDDASATIIRLSEMYLIRSEATYRISEGNLSAALSDLNTIRERAGLAPFSEGDNIDFLEELFLERRRELAFEGHLIFDLMRFKKPIVRNKGCLSSLCELPYPNPRFILPIPTSSVELNENVKQNEDY